MANRRKKPKADTSADNVPVKEESPQITEEQRERSREAAQRIMQSMEKGARMLRDNEPDITKLYESLTPMVEEIRQAAAEVVNNLSGINAGQWMETLKALHDMAQYRFPALYAIIQEREELEPYLREELKKEKYGGKTFDELMEEAEAEIAESAEQPRDISKNSLAYKAWEAASRARDAATHLPIIQYKQSRSVDVGLDKFSMFFFSLGAPGPRDINGQMSFLQRDDLIPLKYEQDGNPEVTLFYSFYQEEEIFKQLGISKKIDDEDFWIAIIINDMALRGDINTTPNKIYKELYGKDPNGKQWQKMVDRLYKGAATKLYVNDREVREAWGIVDPDDDEATYNDYLTDLLPIEVSGKRFLANGKPAKVSIHINHPPRFLELAAKMGQVTTIPKALLYNDLTHNSRYHRIMHYLVSRIAHMKNPKTTTKNRILFSSIYEVTGDKTPKQQAAAKKMTLDILEHFKTCPAHWIDGYKDETTASTGEAGVTIYVQKDLPVKKKGQLPNKSKPKNR